MFQNECEGYIYGFESTEVSNSIKILYKQSILDKKDLAGIVIHNLVLTQSAALGVAASLPVQTPEFGYGPLGNK